VFDFCVSYRESALEHVLIVDEDSDSLQRLQDNIRMLQVFKQQNGDYLNKLFETVMKECI
jgi:5'-3' exonuclease